ncbi:hypothetical protein INT45_011460 [Circinella minor]|uniref:Cyclin n=1 Tax=Circinella minor TaxID=1195481 RepID=A0A8H7SCM8_9FUNG|nr:hypothetical protein INT45_011460 [Circinella minor]
MSTRNFIQEILKRSKTTYSTLQIALFYLFRVKKVVHEKLVRRHTIVLPPTPPSSQEDYFDDQQQQQHHNNNNNNDNEDCDGPARKKQKRQVSERLDDIMCCGRRMFLASLMVSSKYLHDKNYRNRAWAKISGLDIKEINAAELAFLRLIDYKLYVSKPTFDKWYTLLHGYVQKQQKQKQQQNTSNLTSCPNNSFSITPTSITKDNTTLITTNTSSCCPSIKPEV